MVEEEQTDPLEITKESDVVKNAQNELSKVDVLVCGECHEVFHFLEQFQEHKTGDKCTKQSTLKQGSQSDNKSQIWGFMLWKNAKFKTPSTEENPPSSWNIYQLWCNLDQTQKDSWIVAGKSLQNIHNLTLNTFTSPPQKRGSLKLLNKKTEQEDDITETKRSGLENDPLADTESDLDLEEELAKHKLLKDVKCENGGIKKAILKPVELNSDVTILPSNKKGPKKAIRTHEGEKKGEYAVEKIVSKRYNPGKKTHEYLIKWENFSDDQNTWEPIAHLESCKQLVEEFDRHLQKLKAQKLSRGSLVQRKPHKKRIPDRNTDLILTSTGPGRPQRTSKQKALNQVKVWCGNISDADEGGSSKRAYSDSDSDSFEKKMKLEEESTDSEDDVRPPITVRKVMKTPLNGIARKQPLPENILVPDAHGVVTINQKQLPALSSGVYVMSKTAGIIKLDSNTSKIAASGGHAVIKVAPKIGQTSIKVVKRDPSNGSKPTILNSKFKQMVKPIGAKVIAHRRIPTASIIRKTDPIIRVEQRVEDDESDGLEELPFPTDLPLPEPDSPPGEFTLCPLTGKILGQDYSEEEQNISVKQEAAETNTTSNEYSTLAVLNDLTSCNDLADSPPVKIEAVEQDNSTTDNNSTVENVAIKPKETTPADKSESVKQEEIDKTQSIEAALSAMEADDTPILTTVTTTPAITSSTSSILSTALSNANIEPSMPSMSTTPTLLKKVDVVPEAIKQKTAMNRHIINRTIVPKPAPQAIITRITPGAVNKNKQILSKQKMGGPPPTTFRKAIRQTYSNKSPNVIRKIGSTTVYHNKSTPTLINKQPTTLSTSITTESLVETLTSSASNEVINMPLLSDLDAPSTSTEIINPEPDTQTEGPSSIPAIEENINTTDLGTAINLNESDTPLLITGEDGTIYQVAGQNEDGQTILIAQDADGQQQCLLVASESASELAETATVTTPVTAESPEEIEEPVLVNSEQEGDNGEDSQIVAQIVSAQPPSPGGTRKVVLMLPDGNLMMTEVTAEQYAALELDK